MSQRHDDVFRGKKKTDKTTDYSSAQAGDVDTVLTGNMQNYLFSLSFHGIANNEQYRLDVTLQKIWTTLVLWLLAFVFDQPLDGLALLSFIHTHTHASFSWDTYTQEDKADWLKDIKKIGPPQDFQTLNFLVH